MRESTFYDSKVRELADINKKIDVLKKRKSELEAWFLAVGNEELKDSKSKSICYKAADNSARVTYTQAQKLQLEAPTYLKKLLGDVFSDFIKETIETSYSVKSAAVERMFIGLYTGGYTKTTPTEVIKQLPCAADRQDALAKKLKGANFEADVKNLIEIGGLSEAAASDYAYLFAEAVVYDTLLRLLSVSEAETENIDEIIKGIAVAVSVDDTTKISIK